MKILICPDSFKESINAADVGKHLFNGILQALPDATCKIIPMADGGEGTVDSFITSQGGHLIKTKVRDPLMRPVVAYYGLLGDKKTAVIEMAAASGLHLLKKKDRNPMTATSYGTGELIRSALDHGCNKIILGIGGSATVDGGTGMAQALGIRFSDRYGNDTGKGGGTLNSITGIDTTNLDPRIKNCKILVACDVSNPLTGKEGAAYVYGPQKGATHEMVKTLDSNLKYLSDVIRRLLHVDIENKQGAGAAGGLGAGLMAFLNAGLEPGFNLIARMSELKKWIGWSDIVLTGEGKIDSQTSFGKVPAGVARIARHLNKPVIAFTGYIDSSWPSGQHSDFIAVIPIADKPMTEKQAMSQAGDLLERAAERTLQLLRLGMTL